MERDVPKMSFELYSAPHKTGELLAACTHNTHTHTQIKQINENNMSKPIPLSTSWLKVNSLAPTYTLPCNTLPFILTRGPTRRSLDLKF